MTPRWVRALPWLAGVALVARPLQAEVLTLEDALRLAREHNPQIHAARQTWRSAQGRALEARALPDPEFELELDGMPTISGAGAAAERAIGVRQRLGWPGEWRRRGAAAQSAAEATRLAEFEVARLDVDHRVRVAHAGVLHAGAVLEDERRSQAVAQAFLDRARLRLAAGDVAELEILRAEVEAGRAASRVAAAAGGLEIARGRLNSLLGRPAGRSLEISGTLDYHPVRADTDSLESLALARRPEVRAARLRIVGAAASHAAERATLIPDFTVGLFRQTINQPGGDDDRWRAEVGMRLPLWGARAPRGRLRAAAAATARAEAELTQVELEVRRQVREACLDLATAARQAEVYEERIVRGAQAAQAAAQRGYDEGKASYLEILEAQRTLAATRVEYADRLYAHRRALASLTRAVGGEEMK